MTKNVTTLESEIVAYANNLPYWCMFLSEKILQSNRITDVEINEAYKYVLEDLGLQPPDTRAAINLAAGNTNLNSYKTDVYLSKLSGIEGVNALAENQVVEFSPNLTIIFGNNGCGKSGYTRLLKKAFYSKTPEDIYPNIYSSATQKPVKAEFTFTSSGTEDPKQFPDNSKDVEFRQFAVFDGKSILKHLENRNQFEFRPAGLNYFGILTNCIRKLETLLDADINKRNTQNNFPALFDGESEIKTLISSLSDKTNIDALKKYIPYSEDDKQKKSSIQAEYDNLLLASKSKEREKSILAKLKQQLEATKNAITNNNRYFSDEHIKRLKSAIENCIAKEKIAQEEGVSNFASESLQNIGSPQWKEFIIAAERFALQQSNTYPTNEDSCLLCHQPLTPQAATLIQNYWKFIKSEAEKEAKEAIQVIEKGIAEFEKLNFSLFPEDSSLTIWLTEFNPEKLQQFNEDISKHKKLSEAIISSLRAKAFNGEIEAFQISTDEYLELITTIEEKLKLLAENAEAKKFQELKQQLDFYTHKEKLALHFTSIEKFVNDQIWITKAGKANWLKRNVTEAEKSLSAKYFNQSYIDTFNQECKQLNGNFGIVINHTGAAGTSYKQLFIEGWNPALILSEGEQNVIGISDFLSEMKMSEINRGIIFDDPVTSLDHERRETIAMRLSQEAATKQVIVFTHDIFFMSSLKYHAEANSIPCLSTSLYKIGDNVGLTKPSMPWIAANVKERCGYLKNDLVRLTKLYKTTEPDSFRLEVKAWCGLLREAWERCVEERLFKGVISRFAVGVESQKLKYVNVTKELIDEITAGMTETSKWAHDQAAGVNTPTPTPVQMEIMITTFETFINTKCKSQ